MKKPKVVWNKSAANQFQDTIRYIRTDSPKNASKVKADILLLIDSLAEYPERHPPDRDKINNSKNAFRAFEKHRLRISYLSQKMK